MKGELMMSKKAMKIGGIAIGALTGVSVLSHVYNAIARRYYQEGKAKAWDEAYNAGKVYGWSKALLYIAAGENMSESQITKYYDAFVKYFK